MKKVTNADLVGAVCGVVAALSIALTVWDKIKEFKITKRPCVLLYSDGMTVYTIKPEKGYFHFCCGPKYVCAHFSIDFKTHID